MTYRALAGSIAAISVLVFGLAVSAIPSQSIDVAYSPDAKTFEGTLTIALDDAPDTVYFLLLANLMEEENTALSARAIDALYPNGFEPARTDILGVTDADGAAVPFHVLAMPSSFQTYSLDRAILAIALDGVDASAGVSIEFVTEVPRLADGDNGITDGILTWRFGWYPVLLIDEDRIAEENGVARYADDRAFPFILPRVFTQATVTVPSELVVIAGTDTVVETTTADQEAEEDRAVAVYELKSETPIRTLALTISDTYAHYVLDGDVPIEVYSLPEHDEEARLFATYAREILAAYEETYGPYPHARLTLVENPGSGGSAFAADGIVWLSTVFFTHRDIPYGGFANRFIEFILAHEIAHMWFGLGIETDLNTDSWLSEGLAQYASISYFEERHGAFEPNLIESVGSGMLEDFVRSQFGYMNLREHQTELPYILNVWDGFDEALVQPAESIQYGNADVIRTYDKGYIVARTIAWTVGTEAFDAALRRAAAEFLDTPLSAAAFKQLLEEESGVDLDAVFDAWVFGDATVDYAAEILFRSKDGATYTTTVRVARDGGVSQPVEVQLTLRTGTTVRQTWSGEETEAVLTFRTPSAGARVTIDPDHLLPDSDRINNSDPVKVYVAVDEAYVPLDGYLLTPSSASGTVMFAYLDRFLVSVSNSSATAQIRIGRSHAVAVAASLEDNGFEAGIGYTYTSFSQVDTGSSSGYLEADVSMSVVARRHVLASGPVTTLAFSLTDLASVTRSATRSLAVTLSNTGAVKALLAVEDEVRILPGLYLQGGAVVGTSVGTWPTALQFTLNELRTSLDLHRNHKLAGLLAIEFPTESAEPYNLMNIAMLDDTHSRVYVAGGMQWTAVSDFGKTSPIVEVGLEQIAELSTLGGLMSFSARVGLAFPVLGSGESVIYFGLSL